jgi:hypothetical protein
MLRHALVGVSLGLMLASLDARACPDCPAGIRRQVSAGIFDDAFAKNLAITALPFGVLAGISAAIHAGLSLRSRRG